MRYQEDKDSLFTDFFSRVKGLDGYDDDKEESEGEKEIMSELLKNKIVPYALRQGEFLIFNIFC